MDDVKETAKVDKDKERSELQSLIEVIPDEEEVAVDAIPLATKPPSIVDFKILKEGKISYIQMIRSDGKFNDGRMGVVRGGVGGLGRRLSPGEAGGMAMFRNHPPW
ncbi:hypothetical protein Tco_0458014 [Tanacetum coccineum]